MPSLKLSFNQKVAFGFAIILVLLTISGGMSLWTLSDISRSNQRVQETAVPVVTEVNKVQIRLLKLANLSALGFNALSEADIRPYRDDFERGLGSLPKASSNLKAWLRRTRNVLSWSPKLSVITRSIPRPCARCSTPNLLCWWPSSRLKMR